jgi:hypothetical protein
MQRLSASRLCTIFPPQRRWQILLPPEAPAEVRRIETMRNRDLRL